MKAIEILKKIISSWIIFLSLLLAGLLLEVPGCSKSNYGTNSGGGTPGSNEVLMQGMSFSPASMTIAAGTTIKWTNQDSYAHTVTSGTPGTPSGVFDSGNIGQGGTFSYKFAQAGTFKYYCKIHTSMTGTITVQ